MSEATPAVQGRMEQTTLVAAVSLEQIRDALQTYALRDELQAMIDVSKPRDVVVDMSAVNFIGSVGFLAFLSVRRQLTTGRIILASLSDNLQKVFALCRLIPTERASVAPFETAQDVAQALERLS